MKIEIDTTQLNWTEVPGRPTVGSFLQTMQWPQRDGKDAPATKLPSLHGLVLAKIETPAFDDAARDFGVVPTGVRTAYRLFMFPQVMHFASAEFPYYGPDRIVAYTKDLDRVVFQTLGLLERDDLAQKAATEKPDTGAPTSSTTHSE